MQKPQSKKQFKIKRKYSKVRKINNSKIITRKFSTSKVPVLFAELLNAKNRRLLVILNEKMIFLFTIIQGTQIN